MPIKSVHITNYYHKDSGGISTSYNFLLAAAEQHKRYIRLIVPGETESVEDLSEFARIYYVPARRSPFFDRRYRVMMPWQYMPTNSIIRKILLAEMPDMIEIRDKYTLSGFGTVVRINMFRRLGRPMLVNFSSERMDDNVGSYISKAGFFKWFARHYMGDFIFPSYDFHITNSAYTAEEFYLSTKGNGNLGRRSWFTNFCWKRLRSARVPVGERIRVCPAGVDAEWFSPERKNEKARRELTERAGIPNDAVILLYSGRISPEKNIELLLEFMRILGKDPNRDFRLVVAGAGPKAEWLKKRTEKLIPNKIIQLGHIDKETLADYYANADVFVHPNPREPYGIAPLEAMASGLPAVVPNSGGLLSYANDENSWMVEPTPEKFANAIRQVVSMPEDRSKKVENALRTARDNTRTGSTDRLLATYDELYLDFRQRNSLYTDREAAKRFDYSPLLT